MRISLVACSRGRPFKLVETLLSLMSTINPNLPVEVLIRIDFDDPTYLSYCEHIPLACPFARLVCGPRLGPGGARAGQEIVMSAKGDLILIFADDIIFFNGWHNELLRVVEEKKDKLVFYTADGYKDEKSVSHPIVRRKWLDILGFFFPHEFFALYADTWIEDVARRANVLHYIPTILIKHNKLSTFDSTMIDARLGEGIKKSKLIYDSLKTQRDLCVEKIKEAMHVKETL